MNLSRAARQDKLSRSGHRVLVAPHWINDVSWSEGKVSVDLPREAVKDLASFESLAQLDRYPGEGIYAYRRRDRGDETASDDRLDLSMSLRRCFSRRGWRTEA
jgi:hypothetical protein